MIAYEREALFGSAEHRDSATASVSRVEEAILEVLQLHQALPRDPSAQLGDIAHIIYAVLYLDLVKVGIGHASIADLESSVERSVNLLVGPLLDS